MLSCVFICIWTNVAGVTVKEEVMDVLSEELSYLVSDLSPFTDYMFRVTASTIVGEGPAADITEKTREQGEWLHVTITINHEKATHNKAYEVCYALKNVFVLNDVLYFLCCSVPSSVLEVSYQNISSTSILVSWVPPLNPNGRITHYTVYGLKLHSNQALKWVSNTTSILIGGE